MTSFLELRKRAGIEVVPLETSAVTIGKVTEADLRVSDDPALSRLHAVVERVGGGWCVRDLGSRNGTFVNGVRVWSQKALHGGDEIKVGGTRLVFRSGSLSGEQTLTAGDGAPDLTTRERDVLVALCRPLLSGDAFAEPASTQRIAAELVVSQAAVKQHLVRLYDKFGIYDEPAGASRRVRLANQAVERGAVRLADLR